MYNEKMTNDVVQMDELDRTFPPSQDTFEEESLPFVSITNITVPFLQILTDIITDQ